MEDFRMLWLEIYSYLTKASFFSLLSWRQSLLLVKEVFLHWSRVCQNITGNIVTTWVNFLMKTNVQCPLENFQILSLKLYSYLTKAWCQRLPFGESAIFTLVSYLSINWKYSDHLSQLSYEKNIQCRLENFQILSLKFVSYLRRACCQSLLLVKDLLLHQSPVCQ